MGYTIKILSVNIAALLLMISGKHLIMGKHSETPIIADFLVSFPCGRFFDYYEM